MSTLTPAPVSTRQFHYDPYTRHFVGFINDTHGLGRVYDDAADEGLTLVSSRTGAELVFVVTDETRDAVGDIRAWVLRSVDGRFTATLFND